jgi:deoxyribodipyrimidine photo-lyase
LTKPAREAPDCGAERRRLAQSLRALRKSLHAIGTILVLRRGPNLPTRNLQPAFDRFTWRRDDRALRAWQRGQTGYPIVDAGMRELWPTGTMHNRVRMVAASFLVRHLLIDWRAGEQWFWDRLVDADPGSNPANWQWVAGSGADAAPHFRAFNPVLQGEKFDSGGAGCRNSRNYPNR